VPAQPPRREGHWLRIRGARKLRRLRVLEQWQWLATCPIVEPPLSWSSGGGATTQVGPAGTFKERPVAVSGIIGAAEAGIPILSPPRLPEIRSGGRVIACFWPDPGAVPAPPGEPADARARQADESCGEWLLSAGNAFGGA